MGVPTTSKNVSFTSIKHIINMHQKVALYTVYVRQFILNTLLNTLHCLWGCRDRDRMVVGFITIHAISAYHH